ncbi:MBL fold metallo-hydrolase [Rhodobacteraceae bacterium NNCM2]|nr:MBL fold metallo-hydrolase [Coraliihabitans acroporae]
MPKPVAEHWYEQTRVADGITLIRERYVAPWLRCNIWHVAGRDRDLIIDTGMGLRPLATEISALRERPVTAVVTHTHFDHAGGLHQFDCRCGHPVEAPIIAAPTDANTVTDTGYVRAETFLALPWEGFSHTDYHVRPAPLTRLIDEGDVIDLGDRVFQVFHLPGHSPGSIALYETGTQILFSGDVVYDGLLLDTIYHSDPEVYRESLARLRELPVSAVHGGHFASFGAARMKELIDEYLSGEGTLGQSADWVESMIADGG